MFDETELFYGDPDSVVWYPGDVPDLSFKFRPNVDLYAGTVIALKLPGFQHSLPIVQFSPPETAVADEYDISGFIPTAEWDQITYELRITVPVGNAVVRRTNILRVRALGNAGFTRVLGVPGWVAQGHLFRMPVMGIAHEPFRDI